MAISEQPENVLPVNPPRVDIGGAQLEQLDDGPAERGVGGRAVIRGSQQYEGDVLP